MRHKGQTNKDYFICRLLLWGKMTSEGGTEFYHVAIYVSDPNIPQCMEHFGPASVGFIEENNG
jgi:hypothetical protein